MRVRALPVCLIALLLTACDPEPAVGPAADTSPSPTTETSTPGSTPASPPGMSTPAPPPEAEPTSETPGQVAVTIVDFSYAPDPIEVAVGGTVTWTNEDSTAHTATISGGGPTTGALSKGASGAITFDTAGTFSYVCQFHPGSMAGTVIVR